jgi:hypothetical protein
MVPPVGSRTVPTRELVTVCPKTAAAATIRKKASNVALRINMDSPLSFK